MSSPHFTYDLFISYAHQDNQGTGAGRITALINALQLDHANSNLDRPLAVFYDQQGVRDLHEWQHRVHKSLQDSAVLVAIISPNYFASEQCRLEWETFLELEHRRAYPDAAISPIYILTDAAFERDEALPADKWRKKLKQRHCHDARDWWKNGSQVFQSAVADELLRPWFEVVCERVRKIRTYRQQPWNLSPLDAHAIDRVEDLQTLRRVLAVQTDAGLSAAHGLSGIGMTSLVRQYCHRYRDEYPGGILEVDCEGLTSELQLRERLTDLAIDYLFSPSQDEERAALELLRGQDSQEAFQQAKSRYENRGRSLLVLSNASPGDWLKKLARDRSLPSSQHVKVLVTSRWKPRDSRGMDWLTLDRPLRIEAVALMRIWRPFEVDAVEAPGSRPIDEDTLTTSDPEWKSAVAIVQRVARLPIAVETLAIYLSLHPEIKLFDYLQELRQKGIGSKFDDADRTAEASWLVDNSATMMEQLLAPTLDALGVDLLASRALEFAALLPRDSVPFAWLKQLVAADPAMAARFMHETATPDPWHEALDRLASWRLLIPITSDESLSVAMGRIHQTVQDVVRERLRADGVQDEREQTVIAFMGAGTFSTTHNDFLDVAGSQELACVVAALRPRLVDVNSRVARVANWICERLMQRGRLSTARDLADAARRTFQRQLESDCFHLDTRRDLSLALETLGDVCSQQGHLASARTLFEDGLAHRRRLVESDPGDVDSQRDMLLTYIKLGDVCLEQGDLSSARQCFEYSQDMGKSLRDNDPNNVEYERDLSISLWRLGDVAERAGDGALSRQFWRAAHDAFTKMKRHGWHPSPQDEEWLQEIRKKLGK